jgi:hypothetical protein
MAAVPVLCGAAIIIARARAAGIAAHCRRRSIGVAALIGRNGDRVAVATPPHTQRHIA